MERNAQHGVNGEDEEAVKRRFTEARGAVVSAFGKEAHGQRNHREHARGQQRQQAADEAEKEDGPVAVVALHFAFSAVSGGCGEVNTGQCRNQARNVGSGSIVVIHKSAFACGQVDAEFKHVGRQTHGVVAQHKQHVALYFAGCTVHFNVLGKHYSTFKEGQIEHEVGVVFNLWRRLVGAISQAVAVGQNVAERSRNRTGIGLEGLRVEVPSFVEHAGKCQSVHVFAHRFAAHAPFRGFVNG